MNKDFERCCSFGEHRDNSRNSQSVFLVVALYNGKGFG